MLDLAPEVEQIVLESAAREGLTPNELLASIFQSKRNGNNTVTETPEQTKRQVFDLLAKWQREAGMPQPVGGSKTLAQLRAEWAAEDANLTEAERAAEATFWEEHTQAMLNSPGVSI